MSYNNLLFSVKRRILDEVVSAFNQHPSYSKKVEVYNKFPYQERVQYGVILRNSSASVVRMSPDNYMAELITHVRLVRHTNYPGLSVEWARENAPEVTDYIVDEDVSDQVGPTQRQFLTSKVILSGPGNTKYANNIGQVRITVNGNQVFPEYINGKRKIVLLQRTPASGDIVKISYYTRNIVDPGIYVLDFNEDNQFTIGPIFIIEDEFLIEGTDGTETSVSLSHNMIESDTDRLYLSSYNDHIPIWLERGTDYTIDYSAGLISFLNPLPKNFNLFADYMYQPGYGVGPYVFKPYQEVHDALKGVVISIGRRAQKGDRQIIIVSEHREDTAKVYGGHWEMSLSLGVIAKDPIQMEEMTDHIVQFLWGQRKNFLEFEGITLNSVEPTGETEEVFIDTTGDLYYESSVDISVMTEWQKFIPYRWKIRKFYVESQLRQEDTTNDYFINKNNKLFWRFLEPDIREVIKYPTIGYERVI